MDRVGPRPLQVVEHQDERARVGRRDDQVDDGVEERLATGVRRGIRAGGPRVGTGRPRDIPTLLGDARQQPPRGLDRRELGRRRDIRPLDREQRPERLIERLERPPDLLHARAEQHRPAVARDARARLAHEARLARAGLAADEHGTADAAPGVVPRLVERRDLFASTDERRLAGGGPTRRERRCGPFPHEAHDTPGRASGR
nr:hypothetical protein [Agromyces protaetiae]